MRRRIDELRRLRSGIRARQPAAFDAARQIGQALRGSGATFGFPELSAVASVLETSEDRHVLRRLEGLITELHGVTQGELHEHVFAAEWLFMAADLSIDSSTPEGVRDAREAWRHVAWGRSWEGRVLAEAVASYLGVDVADLGTRTRAAERLVPTALLAAGRVVPLREDGSSIWIATAEPTSLPMELHLHRVTGRAAIFEVAPPEELDAVLSSMLGVTLSETRRVRAAFAEGGADGRCVLVVDDEATQRLLTRSVLERKGFEVVEAEDGLSALEAMRGPGTGVGLVVADLHMPAMDGLELLWELRADPAWEHLPIIVVTGETDAILETQLIEEGADDYIHKPFDPRLFLARVEATIRRREERSLG